MPPQLPRAPSVPFRVELRTRSGSGHLSDQRSGPTWDHGQGDDHHLGTLGAANDGCSPTQGPTTAPTLTTRRP